MIRRYNRSQFIGAALSLIGGLVCLFLGYLFFRYVPALVADLFGHPLTPLMANGAAVVGLFAVCGSGYRTWRSNGGFHGYHESSLYHDFGGEAVGAAMVDFYVHRITGPAHVISQVFLAGPLLLLRVRTLFFSMVPNVPGLEGRLDATLAALRLANKWQPITDYPNARTEILYLSRMGLIDFSGRKGVPRIKAYLSHGI